jgi:hypothetical protein
VNTIDSINDVLIAISIYLIYVDENVKNVKLSGGDQARGIFFSVLVVKAPKYTESSGTMTSTSSSSLPPFDTLSPESPESLLSLSSSA